MSVFTNRIFVRNTEELNEIYQLINHLRRHDVFGLMIIDDVELVSMRLRDQLVAQIPTLKECIERIWNECRQRNYSSEVRGLILEREARRIGLDINKPVEVEGSEIVVCPLGEVTVV